jgi:dihydroneopterin aldolase
MDKLAITGIKLTTRIGILPWEKQCEQNLYCDITLQTDAKKIAKDDDIASAIDYDKVVQHLVQFVQAKACGLIETLAEQIATELLSHFHTPWVQITLRKPGALLQAKDVAITIERSAS